MSKYMYTDYLMYNAYGHLYMYIVPTFILYQTIGFERIGFEALVLTNNEETEETSLFASIFDHFFDCLNLSNYTSGKKTTKSIPKPI